jgi:hypothetical protein
VARADLDLLGVLVVLMTRNPSRSRDWREDDGGWRHE